MTWLTVEGARKGQYSILETTLPGRPKTPAGVLLLDPAADKAYLKLRDDWDGFADAEEIEVFTELAADLEAKGREIGGEGLLRSLEDTLSNALRITDRETVVVGDFAKAVGRLFERYVLGCEREPVEIRRFHTHLPLYSLQAAAGKFGEDMEVEQDVWVKAPEDLQLSETMFVAQVVGRSMEPKIPESSYCVFRGGLLAGSRQGKLLLIQHKTTSETGGEFTIKRYTSGKAAGEEQWRHELIRLEPLNPEYEAWELEPSELENGPYRVIGEFVRVLVFEEM